MSASQTSPIAALRGAEAVLIGQVREATGLLRDLADGTLDAAMAELLVEAAAVKSRLASNRSVMVNALADVLGDMTAFSAEIRSGLAEPILALPAGPQRAVVHDDGRVIEPADETEEAPASDRVQAMADSLAIDPTLSNRRLCEMHGGNNRTARAARALAIEQLDNKGDRDHVAHQGSASAVA